MVGETTSFYTSTPGYQWLTKVLDRRLNNESSRNDILSNVVGKVKSGEVSKEELTAHASTLV